MLTVTKLARSCGVSRGAVLHYESIGLLKPAARSSGNYRVYSDAEARRLNQICVYRAAGLGLDDIRAIVGRPMHEASSVLQRRLVEINREIDTLREHQRAILSLMTNRDAFIRRKMMTKEKWTAIMRASGFSDDDMRRWHVEFERQAPEDHQQFLESLHIGAEEVRTIREWSRTGTS